MPEATADEAELSLAENVCLALVAESPRHGWSLVRELDRSGELGSIWSLSRALTYRALDQLVEKGLARRGEPEAGRGPSRVSVDATPAGRRRSDVWMASPVAHVRDLRTEFLIKATMLRRRGDDQALLRLLDAEERVLSPVLGSLVDDQADGSPVSLWRRESARSAQRFFADLRASLPG